MIAKMDRDGDGVVTGDDFVVYFESQLASMSDREFNSTIQDFMIVADYVRHRKQPQTFQLTLTLAPTLTSTLTLTLDLSATEA